MKLTALAGAACLPRKFEQPRDEETEQDAHRGQVLVMFALFLVGMLGVLGLATDVGYALAARRAAQGAADAGALAGARQIALYQSSAPTSAIADVNAVVATNTFGEHVPSVFSCEYIGNNWGVVGNCNQAVPASAAGARVKTRVVVPTFFMRVLPGTPDTITVAGYAKARVQRATAIPSDAPFMICGTNAWDVSSDPSGIGTAVGANMNIIDSSSPLKLKSSAVGKTFRIHDPQLDAKGNADCSSVSDQFKGLASGSMNGGKSAGSWFNYSTGSEPGSVLSKVDGAGGCASGTAAPFGCVMMLPVAVSSPAETGTGQKLYVAGFAPFLVTSAGEGRHNATLLDDFIMSGKGANSWCRDCGGPVVIRLIW